VNRTSSAAALLVLATAIGCSSDSSGPPFVEEKPNLVILDGDGQAAAPGNALTHSLVVQAKSINGTPLAGWVVRWTVTGGGQIAPGAPATDASGKAQAQWTLGTSGTQAAEASITYRGANGLTPVSAKFSATLMGPVPKPKPAILHYDGTAWTVAYQPAVTGVLAHHSNRGSSPSTNIALGGYSREEALVT
jgi:hypothetical protein